MTVVECEQRNSAIMQAWEEWKNGENSLGNLDCAILAEMLSIPYPSACQRYLNRTDGRGHASVTTSNKKALSTIFAFIERLYNSVALGELNG